ncbi:MAG TPA: hypothetical protein VH679_12390 [Vicinamibacterales bacterium]|jgi:hypothetical protein
MADSISRRTFLAAGPALAALPLQTAAPAQSPPITDFFPAQPAELVKEVVGVSHGNIDRLKQLVDARPALAKAAWDWGFGDWESAIDAASHVGNRPIAEYLMSKGARPTLFTAAMMGQLDVVKGAIAMAPGIQRNRGPHGITLLAHARFGGDKAVDVLKFLESLGDADPVYAPVALTAADKLALSGVYVFGPGANDRFEVTEDKRGFPSILRPGGTTRALIHLGSMQFHPIGADAVRITFEMAEGRAAALTVHDPEVVVTAKRSGTTL